MYFKISIRKHPETGLSSGYYRLIESYRNSDNRVCHRTILNVGFIDHVEVEKLNVIQKILTQKAEGKIDLFEQGDPVITHYVDVLWQRMVKEKRVDLPLTTMEKRKLVDVETIKHKEVREIGAEWMCHQALEQLKLTDFLKNLGWGEEQIRLTVTQIISRAVYPASELATTSWIRENSAICEISQYPIEKITKDKLYGNALALYSVKDSLEQYLSHKTNELFDIEDKIILYDLTNTYFESEKRNSKLAQYGRSKEKRSDAKLIVLALVINVDGFLKYSNIFEGNTTDHSTLCTIVEKLRLQTSDNQRGIVVLDAGIATAQNLMMLKEKGYDYVCVSRSKVKDYQIEPVTQVKQILTKNNQTLKLTRVQVADETDYYLKVESPGKALKEASMKSLFEHRLEEDLEKIRASLTKKHGVKIYEKVLQRIGRAIQKYPSASKYYDIDVISTDKKSASDVIWTRNFEKNDQVQKELGVYFIRTNLDVRDETKLWKIYNTIREIESTFRTLKTDLDLRPIYHKNDESTLAHIHLGLLAYWLVNTIRYQLKAKGITSGWKEIIRIANTQKLVSTTAQNVEDEVILIKRCSEPTDGLKALYTAIGYCTHPFAKRKSVVHKSELENFKSAQLRYFASD